MGLELYQELKPWQVAQWAAAMRHSRGWTHGYSLKHPRATDDAVAAAQNGQLWLKICHTGHQMIDAHWLKLCDYTNGYAWVDGFVFPDWRGEPDVQRGSYAKFEAWAAEQGFPELYCASFHDNYAAHQWIEDRCDFTYVGLRKEGSPRAPHGRMEDVRVYAKRWTKRAPGPLDMQTVRRRVDAVLGGYWHDEGGDREGARMDAPAPIRGVYGTPSFLELDSTT